MPIYTVLKYAIDNTLCMSQEQTHTHPLSLQGGELDCDQGFDFNKNIVALQSCKKMWSHCIVTTMFRAWTPEKCTQKTTSFPRVTRSINYQTI